MTRNTPPTAWPGGKAFVRKEPSPEAKLIYPFAQYLSKVLILFSRLDIMGKISMFHRA